jgi:two-component system, NtrC family, response regulator HydG
MFTDFRTITDSLPCGLVITDQNLNIHYLNSFASNKIFSVAKNGSPGNMKDHKFFTTDMRMFDMDDCMRNMVEQGKRNFHKTLIIRSGETERLVYFSVKSFSEKNHDYYLFNITDISDEMDCITHSPGTFGKGDYLLRKKIIGHDPKVEEIYRMISLAADADVNVLIQGESGTGKELVADAIHELSYRKNKPFVKVNCAALSETLLESELFGHVKGSFTGAYKDKTGKFEQASGGTIFLDEIGEISQSLQVKLLRVLQEKTIEKVGDNKPVKVDMRIMAATNKDLRELIRKNIFREDLFYRLNVFNIVMPPLRDRHLDIPILIEFFVEKFNRSTSKNIKGVSRDALKILMDYPWPGNIRELQNAIEHAFVLVRGNLIDVEDLPEEIRKGRHAATLKETVDRQNNDLSASVYYAEIFRKNKSGRLKINKEQLKGVLEMHDWNQSKTADYLGISRVALWKKMKKLGL